MPALYLSEAVSMAGLVEQMEGEGVEAEEELLRSCW